MEKESAGHLPQKTLATEARSCATGQHSSSFKSRILERSVSPVDSRAGDLLRQVVEQAERRIIQEIRTLKCNPNVSGDRNCRHDINEDGHHISAPPSRRGTLLSVPRRSELSNSHCSVIPPCAESFAPCSEAPTNDSSFAGKPSFAMQLTDTQSLSLSALEKALDADVIRKRMPSTNQERVGVGSTSQTTVRSIMVSTSSSRSIGKSSGTTLLSENMVMRAQVPTRPVSFAQDPGIVSLYGLQEERQCELVGKAESYESSVASHPLWLLLSGDLPLPLFTKNHLAAAFCTNLNRLIALGLLATCGFFSFCKIVALQREGRLKQTCKISICAKDTILPTMALGFGCACQLCLLISTGVQANGSHDSILKHYLASIGASRLWMVHSRCVMARLLLCWSCVLVVFCTCIYGDEEFDAAEKLMHVVAVAFITNLFFAFVHSMERTCHGLHLVIDNFCCKMFRERSCENAVEDWNVLQATLRQVCIHVARTFIVLLTSSLVALFLPFLFHDRLVATLPGAFAILILLWVSLFIGGVTSMCERVPAFINTLDFGISIDVKRQYVVNYILHSRAGFYMFGVRVTGSMVVQCAYVGFVLVAAITTRFVSKTQN